MDIKLILGALVGVGIYLYNKALVVGDTNSNTTPVITPTINPTVNVLPTPSTVVNPNPIVVNPDPINQIQPYVPSLPQGIFWSEDFENGLSNDVQGLTPWDITGYYNLGLPPPATLYTQGFPVGHPQITTAEAHSGTHSLWSHYEYEDSMTHALTVDYTAARENAGLIKTHSGTFINRMHPPTNNVWMRWYEKYVHGPDSSIDPSGKQMYNKSTSGDWLIVWNLNWDGEIYVIVYTSATIPAYCSHSDRQDTACNYFSNMGSAYNLVDSQWHCIETHADTGNNSGPNSNGSIEVFIDGEQKIGYYNIPVAQTPGQWNMITHYAQAGYGDRYIDDLVVAGQRIGP